MQSPGQVTGELDTKVRDQFDMGRRGRAELSGNEHRTGFCGPSCLMTFETELMSCWGCSRHTAVAWKSVRASRYIKLINVERQKRQPEFGHR